MLIAVIPPHDLLDEYATMGDQYHLILSSEVLSRDDYGSFYRDRIQKGDYVILDNSAHEQLEGQTITQLMEAIRTVYPSEVVLPDRLFFGDDTLDRSTIAASVFRREFPSVSQMGVPQGRTFNEWQACLVGLRQLGVESIGISKDYEVWPGGLYRLVSTVQSFGFAPRQIHMLGWGRELWQLGDLHDQARGVDSAKPIVYALNGVQLPDEITKSNTPTYPRRRTDYFDTDANSRSSEDVSSFHRRATHNIGVFRSTARGRANGTKTPGTGRVRSV